MSDSSRFTITAALPYANGPIHIGHLAGVYIPADIFARYKRKVGSDVLYVCGSDEHGVPITIKAKKNNIKPQEVIDKYHTMIQSSFLEFGISFDVYDRTSNKEHHLVAQEFFKQLESNNKFIKKTTWEYYDQKEQTFLADRYIKGTCPICGHEDAYGDQCEKCGTSLHPSELKNPQSALSGQKLTKKETSHWYLPLEKHEEWLKNWILKQNEERWKSNVVGQCKSWIESGLKSRAVTRDLDWGVKVPIDGEEGKVLYVWFDAPIGYISATKIWAKKNNLNWETYWKDSKTKLIHFIGKDNIVFHSIIFPIILKSHGKYILPTNIPANEFLNLEGEKLSTSRNWAIWLHEYLIDFKGKEDSLRYALCATSPEGKDTDFTWSEFQARNNNELVAIFGNYVNRVFVLINKYWDGIVPKVNTLDAYDKEVLSQLKKYPEKIGASIELFKFKDALSTLINLARLGNKYLADTEPWKLKAKNEERLETIMNISIQIVTSLAILSEPFLPFTSKKAKKILNIKKMNWKNAGKINVKDGHKIEKAMHLFEKIENDEIESQLKKLNS